MAPRSRPPTGKVANPVILIEGEDKAGKSLNPALFAEGSERIGDVYWIDLNEGAADEYGDPNNPKWRVIEHNGSYADVLDQIREVKAEAAKAMAAGEKPVVLVIDTFTAVWEGLKDWVTQRAMRSKDGVAAIREDREVKIPRQFWNDANTRYRRMMTELLTFPGIVILTARGKEVSDTDPGTGQPYRDGRKTWKVEGQANLKFDVGHVIRLTRSAPPLIVGVRSRRPELAIQPGVDRPVSVEGHRDDLIDWFIFDALGYDPSVSHTRNLTDFHGGELTPEERADEEGQQISVTRHPQTEEVKEAIQAALVPTDSAAKIAGLGQLWRTFGEQVLQTVMLDWYGTPLSADKVALALVERVKEADRKAAEEAAAAQQPAQEPAQSPATEALTEHFVGAQEPAQEPVQEPVQVHAQQEPVSEGARAAAEQTARDDARITDPVYAAFYDEIAGQAMVMNVQPSAYVAPLLATNQNATRVTDILKPVVHRWIADQRPAVIDALRGQGRATEADAYSRVPPTSYGAWDMLTGAHAQVEQARVPQDA